MVRHSECFTKEKYNQVRLGHDVYEGFEGIPMENRQFSVIIQA